MSKWGCWIGLILFGSFGFLLSAQEVEKIDHNKVYRFPGSVGVEAQFPTPLKLFGTDYQGDFNLFDFSAVGHIPLMSIPQLQPLVRLGVATTKSVYDGADSESNLFDHTRFYLAGGLAYVHKFSKSLELGGELEFGAGYSLFPEIDLVNHEAHSAWNIQAGVGGRVSFNPAFNFTINIHPSLQYLYSLSPLKRFNGFTLAIGVTAAYRFGIDPDDPRAQIRSIEFHQPDVEDMFAAMQSFYVDHPVGQVEIRNTESYALEDVTVSFFQPGYMNIGTTAEVIPSLKPGESRVIPLTASFDQNVFSLEGVTPLTGEIQVDYTLRTRHASQVVPVTYDLYDKNSITWDDDRKVAAFITSGDSALGNYMSFLRQSCRNVVNPGYCENVQTAMQVFYGLTEIGCLYQRDPTLAFENAQGDSLVVDSVNLPRETLVKLAGDCDDLMVLYNAMLESAGIETGFVTVPGHIYSIF